MVAELRRGVADLRSGGPDTGVDCRLSAAALDSTDAAGVGELAQGPGGLPRWQ